MTETSVIRTKLPAPAASPMLCSPEEEFTEARRVRMCSREWTRCHRHFCRGGRCPFTLPLRVEVQSLCLAVCAQMLGTQPYPEELGVRLVDG